MSNSSDRLPLYFALGVGALALIAVCCVGVGAVGFLLTSRESASESMGAYEPSYNAPYAAPVTNEGYGDTTPAIPPFGYHTVSGSGYSFAVPDSWTSMDYPGVLGMYVSSNPVGEFAANVNVTNEPFYGDVDAYVAAARQQLGPYATITGETTATMGSLPARDLTASWPTPARVSVQRVGVVGGRAWIVTCSVGDAEAQNTSAICTPILDTIRVY